MGHRPPDPCLRRQPALRHGVNEPQRTRRGATAAPCRPDTSTTLVAGIRAAPLFPPPTGPRRRERTGQTLTVSERRGPGQLRHDRTDRARGDACRCRDPRQRRARRRPALELTRSKGPTIRRETFTMHAQAWAITLFDEPDAATAERGEGSIEPCVAEKRRILESLGGNERRPGRASFGRDRLKRAPLGSGEAVRRCRQLLEQSPQRRPEKWQLWRSSFRA